MPQDTFEPGFIVPAFVEGLEDMDHLRLVESVEMRNHSVQLVNLVLLFIGRDRSALYTDVLRPSGEALVRAGKSAGQFYDALPKYVLAFRSRDWKWIENKIVEIDFYETACVPIERDRGENPEQECLIRFVTSRP